MDLHIFIYSYIHTATSTQHESPRLFTDGNLNIRSLFGTFSPFREVSPLFECSWILIFGLLRNAVHVTSCVFSSPHSLIDQFQPNLTSCLKIQSYYRIAQIKFAGSVCLPQNAPFLFMEPKHTCTSHFSPFLFGFHFQYHVLAKKTLVFNY